MFVRLGQEFLAARLEDVEGDVVRGAGGSELFDSATARDRAALQRLKAEPPLVPHDELTVEDQAGRQVRCRAYQVGEVPLDE